MSKKTLISLGVLTVFSLTGCFGGNDSSGSNQEVVGTKQNYESTEFTINLPLDWETVEPDKFTSNVPSGTQVAFVNNIKSDRFTANVNVNATELTEENISVEDFAKSSMEKAQNTLTDFQSLSLQSVKVAFGEESLPGAHITFSGKRNASDPTVVWQQVLVIQDNIGYTVSGAYLSDEDESVVKEVTDMLNSFALK